MEKTVLRSKKTEDTTSVEKHVTHRDTNKYEHRDKCNHCGLKNKQLNICRLGTANAGGVSKITILQQCIGIEAIPVMILR